LQQGGRFPCIHRRIIEIKLGHRRCLARRWRRSYQATAKGGRRVRRAALTPARGGSRGGRGRRKS
jgi:hypothetical protein